MTETGKTGEIVNFAEQKRLREIEVRVAELRLEHFLRMCRSRTAGEVAVATDDVLAQLSLLRLEVHTMQQQEASA
jgi:hypothetical protein